MDKRKLVVGLLAGLFYLDVCLAVISIIKLPPTRLPWFYYPQQPSYFEEPNPYLHDCWTDEQCEDQEDET